MEKKSNQKSVLVLDQQERRARAATKIQRAWRRYIVSNKLRFIMIDQKRFLVFLI